MAREHTRPSDKFDDTEHDRLAKERLKEKGGDVAAPRKRAGDKKPEGKKTAKKTPSNARRPTAADTDKPPSGKSSPTKGMRGPDDLPRANSMRTRRDSGTTAGDAAGAEEQPSQEEVERRAYEIWQEQGKEGDPHDHWRRAEEELRGGHGGQR